MSDNKLMIFLAAAAVVFAFGQLFLAAIGVALQLAQVLLQVVQLMAR